MQLMRKSFSSVIFYSFYILEMNYIEFRQTLDAYMKAANSDDCFADNGKHISLHINGGREIGRRIHNYSAAWLSLVDHTRIIYNKLKASEIPHVQNFAVEYDTKMNECLKDNFENLFIKDLRRYVQHKKVPVPTLQFKANSSQAGFSFEFNSSEIENFDWNRKVKNYIESHRSIPIGEIIEKHFFVMKEFYLWIEFREIQLDPYAPSELRETTFELWKQKKL